MGGPLGVGRTPTGHFSDMREPRTIFSGHGVQPIREFSAGAAHTLVALTVDALDAVPDYDVNRIVPVADLESILPLITRRGGIGHACGDRGPTGTPPDLRNQADDFIDIRVTDRQRARPSAGCHRSDGPTDLESATP